MNTKADELIATIIMKCNVTNILSNKESCLFVTNLMSVLAVLYVICVLLYDIHQTCQCYKYRPSYT